jgi:osmotically-inducible protein OsmY
MEATLSTTPLVEQVQSALNRNPYFPARKLRVEATDGHVLIEGTVGSFFQKQMAQEVVRRLDGVERVVNQLQVSWT